jgi:hypothetical protein
MRLKDWLPAACDGGGKDCARQVICYYRFGRPVRFL